jgi:hypothetical protein
VSPANIDAICDREIADATPEHAAKVKFMRDYLTDPHFRAAVEAFIVNRASTGSRRLH